MHEHGPMDHVKDQKVWEFINNNVLGNWSIELPKLFERPGVQPFWL